MGNVKQNCIEASAIALVLLLLVAASRAQSTTEPRIAGPSYWSAVGATALVTAADAGTTLAIPNVREVSTPWLYGTHPRPARTIIAMSLEVVGSSLVAYELKKNHGGRMSRYWWAPLAYMTAVHGKGTIHNIREIERMP